MTYKPISIDHWLKWVAILGPIFGFLVGNCSGLLIAYQAFGTTLLATYGPESSSTNQFYDASNVLRTSDSDWATNEVTVTETFATTTLYLTLVSASSNVTIAHLFVSEVLPSSSPTGVHINGGKVNINGVKTII